LWSGEEHDAVLRFDLHEEHGKREKQAHAERFTIGDVRDYGNRMGIPTANGAVYFDMGYVGNPLVFCGTVGLIPAIAYLMKIGTLSFDEKTATVVKNIPWKDINQKFKNNFDKTLDYIFSSKSEEEKILLKSFTEKVLEEIKNLKLNLLGKKIIPPEGY
jgi:hypothetical protein